MSVERDYEAALAAEDAERFEDALEAYDALLSERTSEEAIGKLVRFRRCCVLFELGRWQEVLDCLASFDAPNRTFATEVAVLEGQAARELGMLQRAKAAYRRATELEPDASHHWCLLAEVHRGLGERHENVACLERALAVEPDYAEGHFNLGADAMREGRHSQAKQYFERVIALDPTFAPARAHLGRLLIEEDGVAAERELRRALELDPDDYWAHVYFGSLLFERGRHEDSAVHFAEAVRLAPDDSLAHAFLADALAALGETGRAEAECRMAIDLADHVELPMARYRLGKLLFENGRRDEGLVELRLAEMLGSKSAAEFIEQKRRGEGEHELRAHHEHGTSLEIVTTRARRRVASLTSGHRAVAAERGAS